MKVAVHQPLLGRRRISIEKLDGTLDGIFELQDRIATAVIGAIDLASRFQNSLIDHLRLSHN